MVKIAFFDIDGTLVSFKTHAIPASAIEAIDRLHDKGVEIVIATGRAATGTPYIGVLPYSAVIGLNGSECVMRDGRVIYRHSIPHDLFIKALEAGDRFGFAVAAKVDEGFIVNRITPRVQEMSDKIGTPLPKVVNLYTLSPSEQVGQLCFYTDSETEHKVMPLLPGLTASRWCDIFADVNISGIDKGTAIAEYAAFRGVDLRDTIAFGDGANDLPMLLKAGTGVAMGNAASDIQRRADYVTASVDDDGIARAISRLLK